MKTFLRLGMTSVAFAIGCTIAYGCSSDNPTTPGGGGDDGGADAPADVKTQKTPEGGPDANKDGDIDPGCSPQDVTSFAPKWKPPAPLHAGACSDAQAEQVIRCSFDSSADQAACKSFAADKSNAACSKCILTADSAAKLGPVILTGKLARFNTDGCVANFEGDTSANSCGAKQQAATDCAGAACRDVCPGEDAAAIKALNECENAAETSVCKSFVDAASCINDLTKAGGVAEDCAKGDTQIDLAINLSILFCGGSQPDGGVTDAPSGG